MTLNIRVILVFLLIAATAALALPDIRSMFYDSNLSWLYLLMLSFMVSAAGCPVAIRVAEKLRIVDAPGGRKIHDRPVPLLGGVVVFVSIYVCVIYHFHLLLPLKGIMIGSAMLVIVGLLDDTKGVSSRIRLLTQFAAVCVMVKHGVILTLFPNETWGLVLNFVLTCVWVIGITNAFNFFDGMDGLAAGIAVCACLIFFAIACERHQDQLALLAVTAIGSCIGFLLYNSKPAKIFLGDAGSTSLGFFIASIAVMGSWSERIPVVSLSVPVLVLGVLIFDMLYTTLDRVGTGRVKSVYEWMEYTDTDHLHHRLVALGFTEKQTVLFIYLLTLLLGISALVLTRTRATHDAFILLLQGLAIFIVIAILMLVGGSRSRR